MKCGFIYIYVEKVKSELKSFGWQSADNDGYLYYISNGYKYSGDYSISDIRRKKLNKLMENV